MAGKKKQSVSTEGTQSKSEFIRSLPVSMSAKEVVEQAATRGMVLTPAHVYNVRSTSNMTSGRAGRKPGSGAASKKTGPAVPARSMGAGGSRAGEDRLRQAIADIGLVRATEILDSVRSTILG
jgi:hypothetical protein